MSTTNAITEQQPPDQTPGNTGVSPDVPAPGPVPDLTAPSNLRDDDLSLPRTVGLAGAVLVFASTIALLSQTAEKPWLNINAGFALLLMVVGLCSLLYHSAFDRDVTFRRLYLIFSVVLLLVGVVLCLIKSPKQMGDQLRYGGPALLVALLFFMASLRNETDAAFRRLMESVLGAAGGLMALGALVALLLVRVQAAEMLQGHLLPVGLVLALFGLVYAFAFIKARGIADDQAYYVSLGMIGVGAVLGLIALGHTYKSVSPGNYFTSVGILLIRLGLIYALCGFVLATDWPVFVMFRRELGAIFFSPIVYLVLFAFSGIWFVNALNFYTRLFPEPPRTANLVEPVVAFYVLNIFPIITAIFAAPVLTMGAFSEENRSGTVEVLFTAPVSEAQVLTSKFLASWIAYMVTWVPAGLYLLALKMAGAADFDYRPLLSYLNMLEVWGLAFVAVGLFFSSVTRQMLIAAVLSFAVMLMWTFLYLLIENAGETSNWSKFASLSYIHAWESGLKGQVVPRNLLFPLGVTAFFLFLTHRVLDSRRWR